MSFYCISCKANIDRDYKACPFCGEPVTDFVRENLEHPIDGKYQILSRLGIGGMGEVFKVLHTHLNAVRVIKLMRANIANEKTAHERFLREARLATLIQHPNVAVLHDFSSLPDGTFYMVWEYIEGTNLAEVIRERGALSPRYAAEVSVDALMGLEAIHRAGIVHRDISPENLMITRDEFGDERVKIIDLGIAKGAESADEGTKTGMFLGKWKYCSPEHLGAMKPGEKIDPRADLYSFGVVIYEMLTGQPPFIADTPHQYILMHSQSHPAPIAALHNGDPAGAAFDALIFRALSKDRSERFASAREFALAIRELIPTLSSESINELGDSTLRLKKLPAIGASFADTDVTGGFRSVPVGTPTVRTLVHESPATPGSMAAPTLAATLAVEQPRLKAAVPEDTIAVDMDSRQAAVAEKPARRLLPMALGAASLATVLGVGSVLMFQNARQPAEIEGSPADVASTTTGRLVTAITGTPATSTVTVTSSPETATTTLLAVTATRPATPLKPTPIAPPRSQATQLSAPAPVAMPAPAPVQAEATLVHAESTETIQMTPGRRAKRFVQSREYRDGTPRGVIGSYEDMIEGDGYYFSVAPGVRLSNYNIRVGRFRNLGSSNSAAMLNYLNEVLPKNLAELAADERASGGTLTTENAIYWASDEKGGKRGVGVEMIFRDASGRLMAKFRHRIFENSAEDGAQEMVDAIAEFVQDHPVTR